MLRRSTHAPAQRRHYDHTRQHSLAVHPRPQRVAPSTAAAASNDNNSSTDPSTSSSSSSSTAAQNPYNWTFDTPTQPDPRVQYLPVSIIRRPLARTRQNDQAKVDALMKSIMEIGLQEPIDVLLVDGNYFGFSGCHRFEAHQRLGLPTIKCRVRRATPQVLKMHMM